MNGVRDSAVETDLFALRVRERVTSLGPAGRRVVRYIEQNRTTVLASSAVEIAANTGTSDATVIRTVQALGYSGISDLKQGLVSSLNGPSTPADDMRRTLADLSPGTTRAINSVLRAHMETLRVLRSVPFRTQIAHAVTAMHTAERIVVFGIGPSAALARYVAVLLNRLGRCSRSLDVTGIMLADQLLDLRRGDVVLALAYGRAYREVTGLFGAARELRLPTVLISDTDDSGLAKAADVVVVIPRGRRQQVALHGGTLVGLEALLLAIAAANGEVSLTTLERLNDLRLAVSGQRHDVSEQAKRETDDLNISRASGGSARNRTVQT